MEWCNHLEIKSSRASRITLKSSQVINDKKSRWIETALTQNYRPSIKRSQTATKIQHIQSNNPPTINMLTKVYKNTNLNHLIQFNSPIEICFQFIVSLLVTALVGVCADDQQLLNDDVVDYVVSRVQRQAPVVTSAVSGQATADGKQKAVPFLTSFQRLVISIQQFKSAKIKEISFIFNS